MPASRTRPLWVSELRDRMGGGEALDSHGCERLAREHIAENHHLDVRDFLASISAGYSTPLIPRGLTWFDLRELLGDPHRADSRGDRLRPLLDASALDWMLGQRPGHPWKVLNQWLARTALVQADGDEKNLNAVADAWPPALALFDWLLANGNYGSLTLRRARAREEHDYFKMYWDAHRDEIATYIAGVFLPQLVEWVNDGKQLPDLVWTGLPCPGWSHRPWVDPIVNLMRHKNNGVTLFLGQLSKATGTPPRLAEFHRLVGWISPEKGPRGAVTLRPKDVSLIREILAWVQTYLPSRYERLGPWLPVLAMDPRATRSFGQTSELNELLVQLNRIVQALVHPGLPEGWQYMRPIEDVFSQPFGVRITRP